MKNFEEKSCLCALNRIFGFDPKLGTALISHLGSAKEVFSLGSEGLDSLLGPFSKHKGHICERTLEDASAEIIRLQNQGIQFHGITEPTYPPLLKECEDAPVGLYIKSSTPASELWTNDSIAIVGTRDISPYGKEWCNRIVKGMSLTESRPSIISGLALGVDIEAHRTALENGIPTIAVMATGPEDIYPHRHRKFADTMADTPGCALITDYPPGTAPLAVHFLRRNRIIAGLSRATVLVESRIRGGGMMTCRLAFSYNRDVYALPGRVDDIRSAGCNELIRRKIAEPITSVQTLTDSLGFIRGSKSSKTDLARIIYGCYKGKCTDESIGIMTGIVTIIMKNRGITVEELAERLGIGYVRTAELTGLLEADDIVITDLLQRCSINPKKM